MNKMSRIRNMRIMVFYDLPNNTKKETKEYTKFHSFLLKNGFYMIQYSIYSKLCSNHDIASINHKKIENNLPKYGNVRTLTITEKQYGEMKILVGSKSFQEEKTSMEPLVII